MRFPRIGFAEIALGLSTAGLLVLGTVLTLRALEPPPLSFEAIAVNNPQVTTSELLEVTAATVRRETKGCINGVQVDLRDGNNALIRLPIPAREVKGSESKYKIVIPDDTLPGRYQMQVREVFTCADGVEPVEAPWVPIEVVEDDPA